MALTAAAVKKELKKLADPEKAVFYPRYFKAGPGEYGEADRFIGVTVPKMRRVARAFREMPLGEVQTLLRSRIHEHRYTALLVLVVQYERGDEAVRERVTNFYLQNLDYVNNWDLVDTSAPYILGPQLYESDRKVLNKLIASGQLWRQRVAVLATYYFIRQGDFSTTLKFAEQLLAHEHDLIHKAVGWMLREVGNRERVVLEKFLKKHYTVMPRTMLRYAIEKFPEARRQAYLKGRV